VAFQRSLLTDFTAGELSPKLAGRADLAIYAKGAATLSNWVPFAQGGIITRPGTVYKGTTKSGATARLIPFVVSDTYPFIVEFTNNLMRVWLNGVLVESGPGVPLEIVSTYTAAELWEIQFAKINNELYLVHYNHPIAILTWSGGSTFALTDLTITFGTGVAAWTALTTYAVGDVCYNGTPQTIYQCITAGASAAAGGPTTQLDDITDGSAHWTWLFTKPFSGASDYPCCICHFQGRMWYAGSVNDPQNVWASVPYDYGNLNYFQFITYTSRQIKAEASWANPLIPETEDVTKTDIVVGEGSAIEMQLASDLDDDIYWMVGADSLVIGTNMSEWVIPPSVTALDIQAKVRSRFGSAFVQPTFFGEAPVFVQGTTAKALLREYAYLAQSSELNSPDLTFTADQMLASGCTQLAIARVPQPTMFCVTNGELAALLYDKAYSILAWYHIILASGTVESVCVVPGAHDNEIYVSVKRAGDIRCIEKLNHLWDLPVSTTDVPLDSCTAAITIAGATAAGLERLALLTATIFNVTDGTLHTAVVSAGGVLTYPTGDGVGDLVLIGLPITCSAQTMRLNSQTASGPGQTAIKRIVAVTARVLTSRAFKAGYSNTAALLETARRPDGVAWTAAYTGDLRIPFQGDWNRDGYVWLVQDQPYRTIVQALVPEVDS
jgi:hypothetical protein